MPFYQFRGWLFGPVFFFTSRPFGSKRRKILPTKNLGHETYPGKIRLLVQLDWIPARERFRPARMLKSQICEDLDWISQDVNVALGRLSVMHVVVIF